MNQLEEWTRLISKRLKSEAELVGVQGRHELYEDAARSTFIRVVLDQFLPASYAIGAGRIIDSSGNSSDDQDIVIYRRDFPQMNLPGSTNVFLLESVLATIQVKTKLVRKTFFEALDQCASMSRLEPVISSRVLREIAAKNKLTLISEREYQHRDPLLTARFNLIGRPPSFLYAFSGYQSNYKQLSENIDLWLTYRKEKQLYADMKSCPSIIATQGCFAIRNASPFSMKNNVLFGVGTDIAPIRLIILQVLHALNRNLRAPSDSQGAKTGLDAYLNPASPPKVEEGVGRNSNLRTSAPVSAHSQESMMEKLLRPAAAAEATSTNQTKSVSDTGATSPKLAEAKTEPVTSTKKLASEETIPPKPVESLRNNNSIPLKPVESDKVAASTSNEEEELASAILDANDDSSDKGGWPEPVFENVFRPASASLSSIPINNNATFKAESETNEPLDIGHSPLTKSSLKSRLAALSKSRPDEDYEEDEFAQTWRSGPPDEALKEYPTDDMTDPGLETDPDSITKTIP